MKTVEEIIKEVGILAYQGELYEKIKKAIRIAQEQVIEDCASKSFKKNVQVAGENEVWEIVRKEEILKVKSELK